MAHGLNHFDEAGNAWMVDVSAKKETHRTALAEGFILVGGEVMAAVLENRVKKGDVLGVAQVAGIMAAKRTAELIPMCHPLLLTKVAVRFTPFPAENKIRCHCEVGVDGQTGVEMEALQGVTTALLTIYDMCKAIDKSMRITDIHLLEKTGGKSGDFFYQSTKGGE